MLRLTQNEVQMHTSLQFGHHSKNQLFSKLTLCPLREIVLWPFLVRWTMSWRVYKPWTDNSLTDQVMVYSHIFQHQHTKGIFSLTIAFPIRLQQVLFEMGAQKIHSPYLLPSQPASCRPVISAWGWCTLPNQLPFSLELCRYSLLRDLICSQRASELRGLQFRRIYKMRWAILLKSKCLWEIYTPSLFSLRLSRSKSIFSKGNFENNWPNVWKKIANAPLLPQLPLLSTDEN